MKIEGSVAMVVGADSAVGAAIVRGLHARNAAKVYTASHDPGDERLQADTIPLADVTLLVNCMVAAHPLGVPSPPVGRTLKLIDAFAPVLAANGGGAVVNVLSVPCVGRPWDDTSPEVARQAVDGTLADGLRGRLAAQQTLLLYFEAQLALGSGDQVLDDQCALAGHVAMRVLDQIEARDRPDGNNGSSWFGKTHAQSLQRRQETDE